MKNKTFFQSVKCAIVGGKVAFKSEKNFAIYGVIALVFFVFNLLLGSKISEYGIFFIATAGVFSAEFINTAIEYLCDAVNPQYSEKIKNVKDIAAAGVLAFGVGFFITQGIVLLPKLFSI